MATQFTNIILTLSVKAYRLHPFTSLISSSTKARFGLLRLSTREATRKYCTDAILNNNTCDNEELDNKYTDINKNIDATLVNAVSTILSINTNEALKIVNDVYELKRLSKDDIINIITTAKEAGISIPMIKSNILTFVKNMEFLEKKIYCINYLNDNINDVLPLLNIDLKYLNTLVINDMDTEHKIIKNKIRYLADTLGYSVYDLCELIVNEPIIITLSFDRINTVINLLKEYNYESKDVLNSLWLFKYSPRTISRRSSTVKSAGVDVVKTWVIRCSINLLQRYITTLKKESMLNTIYGSHVKLLSNKLNIDEEEVEFYIKRCPNILEVQLDKVNEVLDVLLKYGYKAEDILQCQRVFLIRTSLLEERLKRLKDIRGPHRLTLIYCSAKSFENTVKSADKIYNKKDI